jgi:class 3 adenylate cyclase
VINPTLLTARPFPVTLRPMELPETTFAEGPEGLVAYQVFGQGAIDLLFVPPWIWDIDAMWDEPRIERFLTRLASFSRVIMFDKRGTGVSDPVPLGALPTLEQWTDDISVVLDAVGVERVAVVGNSEGAQMAMIFAAAHPDRTSALVIIDGAACYLRHDDYPAGLPRRLIDQTFAIGTAVDPDIRPVEMLVPSLQLDEHFQRWFRRFRRGSAPPTLRANMFLTGFEWDVRAALPTISVPTLVLHHTDNKWIRLDHGRFLAEHIRDARLVELPGADAYFYAADPEPMRGEIQSFLTGARDLPEDDRVLATVLFTDIVGSTKRASEVGDRRWHEILDAHDRIGAEQVSRFRGRLIKTTGDGLLATFDGPARAIRCAGGIADAVQGLGIQIRAGLHTGEVELRGEDVGGIAVNLAARVLGEARDGETLVSGTVKDLVVGSGIEFADHGSHELKGVPGEWRLFAVKG